MSVAPQETVEPSTETPDIKVEVEQQPKPTETVDFWKAKAREQESRAKANKTAADELAAIKEAQTTEAEKTADRIRKADETLAGVPKMVSEALKAHLVALHNISDEDAELFLTASDPEVLLKQADRLVARETASATERKRQGNHVPREGTNPTAPENDEREAVRRIFGST